MRQESPFTFRRFGGPLLVSIDQKIATDNICSLRIGNTNLVLTIILSNLFCRILSNTIIKWGEFSLTTGRRDLEKPRDLLNGSLENEQFCFFQFNVSLHNTYYYSKLHIAQRKGKQIIIISLSLLVQWAVFGRLNWLFAGFWSHVKYLHFNRSFYWCVIFVRYALQFRNNVIDVMKHIW